MAADGASVMSGKHHSVAQLLKQDIPNLFILKCVCHSFHLVASKACEKLPNYLEGVCRNIHSYFNCSFKRQTILKEFQSYLELKPHKMLHPSQTRWLSLISVIKRIKEQYSALLLYFTGTFLEKDVNEKVCENIFNVLSKPTTILYFEFLDYFLPLITKLNSEMQSESVKIHVLYNRIHNTFKTIVDCFIKRSEIEKCTCIFQINYEDETIFLDIQDIYLGGKVSEILLEKGFDIDDLIEFKHKCREFLIEICNQIILRFSFNDEGTFLKEMDRIHPDAVKSCKFQTIVPLYHRFKSYFSENEINDLDLEYREVRNMDLSNLVEKDFESFWQICLSNRAQSGQFIFPMLRKLMSLIFCLPHSSAAAERGFSAINLNKTKIRNKLENETLCGILHTKALLKKTNCFDLEVDKLCIELHNVNMYKHK